MRAAWTLVLLAAAAAATASLLARRDGRPGARVAPAQREGDRAVLEGLVLADGRPSPARVEVRLMATHSEQEESLKGTWAPAPERALRLLERLKAPARAAVDVGPDGRFVVEGLEPGTYAVRAQGTDARVGVEGATVAGDEAPQRVVIALTAATGVLEGRVRHADGAPWSGTIVAVWTDRLLERGDVRTLPTEADGRFRLAGLPAGPVAISAVGADGSQSIPKAVVLPFPGELALLFEEGRSLVQGRVVSAHDGTPRVGVEVLGSPQWMGDFGAIDRTRTDAQGRFRILVPTSEGVVRVRADGFVPAESLVGAVGDELEIRVARAGRLRGRATTPEGAPLPGVRVRAAPPYRSGLHRDTEYEARTDAAGRYEILAVPAGEYEVVARGDGRVSSNLLPQAHGGTVRIAADADHTFDLTMVPGFRVVGTVRTAGGTPVAGARASAWRAISPRRHDDGDSLSWKAYVDAGATATTGPDGSFRIDSLVPGVRYDVSVRPTGAAEPPKRGAIARQGSEVRVDFDLPPPRWVEVLVVEKGSGRPIPGARVFAHAFEPPSPDELEGMGMVYFLDAVSVGDLRTDVAGRVRAGPLGRGRVSVSARAPGYTESEDTTVSDAASGDLRATIELARSRAVSGRVVRPDGSPAAGAEVRLRSRSSGSSWTEFPVMADPAGRFQFSSGEAGLSIRATARDGEEATAEQPVPSEATELTLVLSTKARGTAVHARVVDPAGRPVPEARASYATNAGHFGGTVQQGRLEFDLERHGSAEGVESGTVMIESAKDADGAPLPVGRTRVEGVHPGDSIEIRMPAERTIRGVVVDGAGKGVAGARVRADPLDPEDPSGSSNRAAWRWRMADEVRTDERGAFRVGGLGVGDHWVAVLPPEEFTPPDLTEAAAGESDVRIRVAPGRVAVITVLGPNGDPVGDAHVVLTTLRGHTRLGLANLFQGFEGVSHTSDDAGVVRFGGLDPAERYVLGVRPPLSHADAAERVESGWAPADTTIRLAAGRSVSGLVRHADGTPASGVDVSCMRGSGVETSRVTGQDGTFRFTGLEPGTVLLTARIFEPGGMRGPSASAEVEVGATPTVLVLK